MEKYNTTNQFLNELDKLTRQEIPSEAYDRAKQSLLDYLAVTAAGARFQNEKLRAYMEFAQPETGKFAAIGTGKQFTLKEAVFLNGLNGHALDFDDGTNSGIIHLGSPIFSLLLPLSQSRKITIDQLLRAAIIGYEASYTMAVSIQPVHKSLGYHATGTCGTLGAVIAASYMLGFTSEERRQAFAAACVSAGGTLKVLDDGSELKPYNVAKTALLALTALQLAKAGFKGHPDSLSGGRGFFKMMTGKEEIELKPLLLNGSYAIQKTYTKPYAACRYCHPAIECAIKLRNEDAVRAADVKNILINTYALAVNGHDHTQIPGSYSAKMSIPYGVAAALMFGKAGLNEYEESCVKNDAILSLARKVHVKSDDKISAAFPAMQTAIVSLELENGAMLKKRVDFPKGEPENPLTEAEFRSRYNDLMRYAGISTAAAEGVYELVQNNCSTEAAALLNLL